MGLLPHFITSPLLERRRPPFARFLSCPLLERQFRHLYALIKKQQWTPMRFLLPVCLFLLW